MKKFASAALAIALLAGCSSAPQVGWQQGSQVTMNTVNVELKSNLWVNLMPTIGEVQEQNVHGALYLKADNELPANLTVDALIIKQGDSEWEIDGDLLELRTHSENQWEVAFVWQIETKILHQKERKKRCVHFLKHRQRFAVDSSEQKRKNIDIRKCFASPSRT